MQIRFYPLLKTYHQYLAFSKIKMLRINKTFSDKWLAQNNDQIGWVRNYKFSKVILLQLLYNDVALTFNIV